MLTSPLFFRSLCLGLLAVALGVPALVQAQVVTVQPPLNNVPISQIVYTNNSTTFTQANSAGAPAVPGGVAPNNTPLNLANVTLNDGAAVVVDIVLTTATVTYVRPTLAIASGVNTIDSSGVVISSTDADAFRTSVAEKVSSRNLRDYWRFDGSTPLGTADFHVSWGEPLLSNDYMFIAERNGNSTMILEPLDISGNIIPGANRVRVLGTYQWNTNVRNTFDAANQNVFLTAFRISQFNSASPIYGVAVNNTEGDADGKIFVMRSVNQTDLRAQKVDSLSIVQAGQTVSYTLTFANLGPAAASGSSVVDPAVGNLTVNSVICASAAGGAACPASGAVTVPNLQSAGGISLPTFPPGSTVVFSITGTAGSAGNSIINTAGINPPVGIGDANPSNNVSTDVNSIVAVAANLSITKSNAVATLAAGATTSYTVTVANAGPGDASNAIVRDPAAAGLSCTSVTCSVASGTAACPAPPALTIANLQGGGITIPTFNANSSLNFVITCEVTATGV